MNATWRSALLVSAVSSLGLALTGCGSSGGGGGGSSTPNLQSLFSGTYCLVGFEGDAGVPDRGAAMWGEITSNGVDMITGGMTARNENGVVGASMPIGPPLTYTVFPDLSLSPTIAYLPFLFGGISSDGNVAVLGSIANTPGLFVLGRKSGTYSDASLNGVYHLCLFQYDQTVLHDGAAWGTAMFNGAGGGDTSTTLNEEGVLGGVIAQPLTYSVAADGSMTGSFLTRPVTGQILANGELIALAGSTAGGIPILLILIQQGAGLSDATFSGTYHGVGIVADPTAPPDTWRCIITTTLADGAGSFSFGAATLNSDGVVQTQPAGGAATPYAVMANGALDVSAGLLLGGVSPSGRFAMFSGGTIGGVDPQLWFFAR